MTDLAIGTLNEVDAVMFMVNATEKLGRGDQFILEHLKSVKQPVFLVINKIDLITKEELFRQLLQHSVINMTLQESFQFLQ